MHAKGMEADVHSWGYLDYRACMHVCEHHACNNAIQKYRSMLQHKQFLCMYIAPAINESHILMKKYDKSTLIEGQIKKRTTTKHNNSIYN